MIPPEEMPAWLDSDFFRQHLDIQDGCEVKTIEFACRKGENFASNIYRAKLERSGGRLESLIVKSRPFGENCFSEEFVKKFNVFAKESQMYEIIDRFEEIFLAAGHGITFAPK